MCCVRNPRNIKTFSSGYPDRRVGDRGDREIVYVPNVYVPLLAPNNSLASTSAILKSSTSPSWDVCYVVSERLERRFCTPPPLDPEEGKLAQPLWPSSIGGVKTGSRIYVCAGVEGENSAVSSAPPLHSQEQLSNRETRLICPSVLRGTPKFLKSALPPHEGVVALLVRL